jgi:PQQ-dependent dehydrogenase (methanol/ethanol family)
MGTKRIEDREENSRQFCRVFLVNFDYLRAFVARTFTSALVGALAIAFSVAAQQRPASNRVDDEALRRAPQAGDEWLTYGLSQSEARYSPLADINTSNVGRLGLGWAYDVGSGGGGQEATPLVWNGTIYGITNWSVVFAVDARTGKERWRWDPQVNQELVRPEICCGVVNRGLAIYQGLVIAPVIDGRLHALDAGTGRPVWESRVAYPQDHYTITMAPRIAKGKVIIGVSGGDRPTRGFFDAYDAMTGRRAWRFYTVPGDPSKPFENPALKKAAETWDGNWWTKGGGGAVWDGFAYDPEAELVYVGTGNAEPWTFHLRSSKDKDNLYVASILAVDVDSGQLKWHYQVVPGDNWDFDSVQHLVLADLVINGRTRKVIMQANKDAFFYVIDRLTGQFISAQPFSYVTWAKGIDQKTGRPIVNDEAFYGTDAILISPGAAALTTGRRCRSIRPRVSSTSRHRRTTASRTRLNRRSIRARVSRLGRSDPRRHQSVHHRQRSGRLQSRAQRDVARLWRGIRSSRKCAGVALAAVGLAAARSPLQATWCFRCSAMDACSHTAPTRETSCSSCRPGCAAAWVPRLPIASTAVNTSR